jgi:FkbM family methyltransferase
MSFTVSKTEAVVDLLDISILLDLKVVRKELPLMSVVLNLISKAAFDWPCDTIKGRILRRSLRAVPKNLTVSVLAGPARGIRWSTGAGVADFWLGDYETEKAELFARHVKPGGIVYDVGANVGFYTLIAARVLGPTGRVIAFEPSPRNLAFLRQNLSLNLITNVKVLDFAVSDSEGETRFFVGNDPRVSKLIATGDITVRTTTLDRQMGELPLPDLIEMDIEGAEYSALRGAEHLLRQSSPVIFLSTHGQDVHRACCELLRSFGYKLRAIGPRSIDETDELYCVKEN